MSKDLSISIVNYNSGQVLVDCLRSIQAVSTEANIDIWIVDNASSDGSVELLQKEFPKYHYILNSENFGFGKAHNQALRQIKTEYTLVLNPDTLLKPGVLAGMLEYMNQNPKVGVSTCKIVYSTGQVDLTAHRGFPTPWASLLYILGNDSLYHLSSRISDQPHPVDAISGAFFFARQAILEKVGFFDEDYFMYAEDIDLCFKIKQAGFEVMYLPGIEIIHYKGVSSGIKKSSSEQTTATKESKLRAFNAFYETMWIFYRKHYLTKYPFFINWLVWLGIHLKWWLAKRKMEV